jgi:hypothetical protein
MNQIIGFLLLGVIAGILSGLLGIGGGLIMVPVLVYIFGFSQHTSQGTSLAVMIPPVGFLAVWKYYQAESVNLTAALILAIGFVLGGLIGGHFAVNLEDLQLRRIFGICMLVVAIKMIFSK